MPVNHFLRVYSEKVEPKVIPLTDGEMTIGRETNNDIHFQDAEISRRHARIFTRGDECYLEDLESTNGTTIDGKPVKKAVALNNGDRVIFGEKVITEYFLSTTESDSIQETKLKMYDAENDDIIENPKPSPKNEKIMTNEENSPRLISSENPENADSEGAPFGIEILRKIPNWAIISLIALLFLILFCLVPLFIIEVTNQWCTLFSGFFNAISPGVCM